MPVEEGRSLGVGVDEGRAIQGHISAAHALNERQSWKTALPKVTDT
jgi:hypothetical protein